MNKKRSAYRHDMSVMVVVFIICCAVIIVAYFVPLLTIPLLILMVVWLVRGIRNFIRRER